MPTPQDLHGALRPGREGWAAAMARLVAPATALAARGPAHQPATPSSNDPGATWFELVTRPLWGLAAHAAGGGRAPRQWDEVRAALTAAVNPDHRWYVGPPFDRNQRLVESAAVGYALAVAPHELWDPLSPAQRDQLTTWLSTAAAAEPVDNNWHFFPVLAATGLRAVGVAVDEAAVAAHLDRLDGFATADGWYFDGHGQQRDYYNPFGFHYYGLQLLGLGALDERRAQRVRERATAFAAQFQHWFAADGSALPYGRSLGYRFAQGAFWSTLPVADLAAVPWAHARGLAERHLSWWWEQPILDRDGVLSVGYRYPNAGVVEQYMGGGSPYWGTKFFAALGAPTGHPFWTVEPAPADRRPRVELQPAPSMLLRRDADGDVTALCGQEAYPWARGGAAKAAKFAYSTLAGFSVPTGGAGLGHGAYDSALALSEDGVHWRVREGGDCLLDGDALVLTWQPWPDVTVRTTLRFTDRGHRRTHELVTGRTLHTAETGCCVPWTAAGHAPAGAVEAAGRAEVGSDGITSAVADQGSSVPRAGQVLVPTAGGNVLFPRTALPMLTAELEPGAHTLTCTAEVHRS